MLPSSFLRRARQHPLLHFLGLSIRDFYVPLFPRRPGKQARKPSLVLYPVKRVMSFVRTSCSQTCYNEFYEGFASKG